VEDPSLILHAEENLEQLSTIMPGCMVGLDDGLNQVNHGLWLLSVQEDMIFPVKYVCGGKGLRDKQGPASL
jgi:hypothetical protein